MTSKLKLYLGRKVKDCLNTPNAFPNLHHLIKIGNSSNSIELNLPLKPIENDPNVQNLNEISKIQPDDIIKNVKINKDETNRSISFEINRNLFVKDVIENCSGPLFDLKKDKIVVEYSSPNVAKPFHLGHLRSTILGNFISNLNVFLNNDIVRMNYLGDWGTQFGFIKIGIEEMKYSTTEIQENPIKLLYKSYVHANALAEKDPSVLQKAKDNFANLENGSEDDMHFWRTILGFTKEELIKTYARLGVKFDEYNYESMYSSKDIKNVIDILRKKDILVKQEDGKETVSIGDKNVSVLKSDGSTLYITRDIAAAIDRYQKYDFDKMYYVVENGQHDHFHALKQILIKMELAWANSLHHVKFGRIRGMSTRKGTAVFLNDILDECRELMTKKQVMSPNTKVPISDIRTSDILGISCVIINDLKQRRQKDYEFSWNKVLQVQGDTGVKFQYTHCRLCNLEENCGAIAAKECIPEALEEPEATILLKELSKFHDVLFAANNELEACILVNYLFHLCNHINKALKVLNVKGANPDIASQRLLLFNTARSVLRNGMLILGLQPLHQM